MKNLLALIVVIARTMVPALVVAAPLTAQQHPTLARGFSAEKAFQVGDLDNVNLFNGNLVVTLPIGQRYATAGDFSYGLTMVYNSNVWQLDEVVQQFEGAGALARAARFDNAGLGWNLSLGRLIEPQEPTNELPSYNYISADGSEHRFSTALRPDAPPAANVSYTTDGSFLRLKLQNAATVATIEFPDGRTHFFSRVGPSPVNEFLPRWRITRIEDKFGNFLEVVYSSNGIGPVWTLTDNYGRAHTVQFQVMGGGIINQNQTESKRVVVTSVTLQSAAGPALYSFGYDPGSEIQRGCPHSAPNYSVYVTPARLTAITLPDGSRYRITNYYDYDPTSRCSKTSGRMKKLDLPTGGSLSWAYGDYVVSTAGGPAECKQSLIFQVNYGVRKRTMSTGGAVPVSGDWYYTPKFLSEGVTPSNHCSTPREGWNAVVDPNGDKTVHYFSIHRRDGLEPSAQGWNTGEFGLPFTRYTDDGSTTKRYLSKEVFDCTGTGPEPTCPATPARRTFVRYESDGTAEFQSLNPRVASERTLFFDDLQVIPGSPPGTPPTIPTSSSTDSSDWDGLGHYRTMFEDGTFTSGGGGNQRTTYTNYNVQPPATGWAPVPLPSAPWLLGLYTEQRVTAPKNSGNDAAAETAKTMACFDDRTGALKRTRVLLGDALNRKDLLVELVRDPAGNVIAERSFGGDPGDAVTDGWCTVPSLGTPQYEIVTTHPNPALNVWKRTSMYAGVAPSYFLEDVDVDPATGLVMRSRDSTRVETAYTYDQMGRLRTAKPPDTAETEVTYTLPTAGNPSATPKVELLQWGPGRSQELTRAEYVFDGLGRLSQERRRTSGTDASGTFSVRETKYDGMGHVTSVSELGDPADLGKKTTFSNFDPFGRARQTTRPDGAVHKSTFAGVRSVTRESSVATQTGGGETPACRIERTDRYGRLSAVEESATALCSEPGQFIVTKYGYDFGNRLLWVRTVDPATTTQFREFGYDHRGFLLWEDSPEKQPSAFAICNTRDVCFARYDAKGHAHRKTEATGDLEYDYDPAERLLRVRDAGSATSCNENTSGANPPQNCWIDYRYGTGTDAADRSLGKVKTSRRFNRVPAVRRDSQGFIPYPWGLVQMSYQYGGSNGAISTTTLGVPSAWQQFNTSQTLDYLGNLKTITYPTGPGGVTEPPPFFTDVPAGNPFRAEIDEVGIEHLVDSCAYNPATGASTYCPNTSMTRGELATPLLRAKYGGSFAPPACTATGYTDVACATNAGPWIAKARQDGILSACAADPAKYCPTEVATRGTLARFLLRAIDGGAYAPPTCTAAAKMFADVSCSDTDADWINEFARRGMGGGCGGGSFCPNGSFTRGELARALVVGMNFAVTIKPSTQRQVTYVYDNNLLRRVESLGMPYVSLGYAPNLALTTIAHRNGITDLIGVDPANLARPKSITTQGLDGAVKWSTGTYHYDGAGNIKSIGTNSHQYQYDRLSRLVGARFYLEPTWSGTLRGQAYTYDAFGNLQNIAATVAGSSGLTTSTNSATNQLAGGTYDRSGNLIVWNTNRYSYDALNQMATFTNSANESWSYLYDASGERVLTLQATIAGGGPPAGGQPPERWTLRDPAGRVLREIYWNWEQGGFNPGTGSEMNDYIYRGSQIAAIETARGVRHLSLDHLGTTRLLTGSRGEIAAYHVYYPFGEEATAYDQDNVRAKFTGHERDLNNPGGAGDDLDYMHARSYSPLVGRFLASDPMAEQSPLPNPQSWNRNSYALNNPLMYIDPDGRAEQLPDWTENMVTGITGFGALGTALAPPSSLTMAVTQRVALSHPVVFAVVATFGAAFFATTELERGVANGTGDHLRAEKMMVGLVTPGSIYALREYEEWLATGVSNDLTVTMTVGDIVDGEQSRIQRSIKWTYEFDPSAVESFGIRQIDDFSSGRVCIEGICVIRH